MHHHGRFDIYSKRSVMHYNMFRPVMKPSLIDWRYSNHHAMIRRGRLCKNHGCVAQNFTTSLFSRTVHDDARIRQSESLTGSVVVWKSLFKLDTQRNGRLGRSSHNGASFEDAMGCFYLTNSKYGQTNRRRNAS
jgi:hypothetical protein